MPEQNNIQEFWDKMKVDYPLAMKEFGDWIDKYKVAHDWEKLFNAGISMVPEESFYDTQAPKFHDLPQAMQHGIFQEFCINYLGGELPSEVFKMFISRDIEHNLSNIEKRELESEVTDGL